MKINEVMNLYSDVLEVKSDIEADKREEDIRKIRVLEDVLDLFQYIFDNTDVLGVNNEKR